MLLLAFGIVQTANPLTVQVQYPRFRAAGPVARLANAEAAARERRATSLFRAQYRKDLPELHKEDIKLGYELSTVPHRITDRTALASGYVQRYDYMAGAHGVASYDAINVGLVRGRARAFGLKDLFRPGQDAVGQSSKALLAILRAENEPMASVDSGEWKGLTKEESERFAVGPKGVLFLFGHYDLGTYSDGTRTVLVPYAKLPGIDRKGVLAAVLGREAKG